MTTTWKNVEVDDRKSSFNSHKYGPLSELRIFFIAYPIEGEYIAFFFDTCLNLKIIDINMEINWIDVAVFISQSTMLLLFH